MKLWWRRWNKVQSRIETQDMITDVPIGYGWIFNGVNWQRSTPNCRSVTKNLEHATKRIHLRQWATKLWMCHHFQRESGRISELQEAPLLTPVSHCAGEIFRHMRQTNVTVPLSAVLTNKAVVLHHHPWTRSFFPPYLSAEPDWNFVAASFWSLLKRDFHK